MTSTAVGGVRHVRTYTADPRFSYAIHIPNASPHRLKPDLLVAVHASERRLDECIERFEVWASRHNLAVIAPLFPAGLFGDSNADGYKTLVEGALRYDLLLNDMIAEAAKTADFGSERFLLQGYSGGAQFAHRYLLVHPHRVIAASIASPGDVTALDTSLRWDGGIGDFEYRFGKPLDFDALRRVPVQLLVGDGDVMTADLSVAAPAAHWASDGARRNASRVDRLRMLEAGLRRSGVRAELTLMPGVQHNDGLPSAVALAQDFFAVALQQERGLRTAQIDVRQGA